jgi:magnesium chelatase family protein
MTTTVQTAYLSGPTGILTTVEVDLLRRLPAVVIVGLPAYSVRETADVVRSAIQAAGFEFPRQRVVVNIGPVEDRKDGLDLAIAVAILVGAGVLKPTEVAFIGGLSLGGETRPVRGLLPRLLSLPQGAEVVVSADQVSLYEAGIALRSRPDLTVWAASDLRAAVTGDGWSAVAPSAPSAPPAPYVEPRLQPVLDALVGQETGRVLLVGRGSRQVAQALSRALPQATPEVQIESACAHSAGNLEPSLSLARPFRAPHHSISLAGLLGDVAGRPGELALAHGGVLLLDEVGLLSTACLQSIKRVLEEGEIRRFGTNPSYPGYPARFFLVLSCDQLDERTEDWAQALGVTLTVHLDNLEQP